MTKRSSQGYFYSELIHNKAAANKILPFLFDIVHPNSIVDIGCGTGTWLSVAKEYGISRILGVDSKFVDKKLLHIENEDFVALDLMHPFDLNERFDLAISLEVAEHLPESSAIDFVNSLVNHADIILFSAAVPFQGGQGHLNEQWPKYWQDLFEQRGFITYDFLRQRFWNDVSIEPWYRQNMLIFTKSSVVLSGYSPVPEVPSLMHPDCFLSLLKIADYNNQYRRKNIFRPEIRSSFSSLIKAIAIKIGLEKLFVKNGGEE